MAPSTSLHSLACLSTKQNMPGLQRDRTHIHSQSWLPYCNDNEYYGGDNDDEEEEEDLKEDGDSDDFCTSKPT